MQALRRFLKALEAELGEEHPAARQVRVTLSPTADANGGTAFGFANGRAVRIY